MKSRNKRIIWRIVALLLMLLSIWVATRWHVWFGNEPELAAEPIMRPAHVLLTFGNENELSRNISW